MNLIASGCFSAAESLWNSTLRKKINPGAAVKAIVGIDKDADPATYIGMLEELIIPSLDCNFELLPPLWTWCCELADKMDEQNELTKAIDLLQAIERATNELQLRIHSSFASYSPFVDRLPPINVTKGLVANSRSNVNLSLSSSSASSLAEPLQSNRSANMSYAFPTVLELGHIKRGALKSGSIPDGVDSCKEPDVLDTTESQVRQKLLDARCLRAARDLGLEQHVANLRLFAGFGGMQNFAKELVRCLSKSTESHDCRYSIFQQKLSPFCKAFGINFDESLLQYLKGLCTSTATTASSIEEAASVARCCEKAANRCQCILIVLRAALFSRYAPSLTELSRDAISWSSSDLSLRSELVEASRLLLIDSIVRKYVGSEGCELFRVDNPRHAVRLLDFVCQHFKAQSALNDALDLADAFNHLSRLDACVALCTNAISGGCFELCSDFTEEMYGRDSILANSTCIRVVYYCREMVSESTSVHFSSLPASKEATLKKSALNATSAASCVLSIMFSQSNIIATESLSAATYSKVDYAHLQSLKRDFLRINELQKDHSVFLSFPDLRSTTALLKVAANLMTPIVVAYAAGDWNLFNLKLARAKRACSLLAGASECQETEFWCAAVSMVASPLKWAFDDGLSTDFLVDVGVLGGFNAPNSVSARASLSAAFGLCLKASNEGKIDFNENIGRAVSLVHDYCLATCPELLLIQCQSLSSLAEMVWHVLLRGDEGIGERLDYFRSNLLIKSWSSKYQVTGIKCDSATENPDPFASSRMPALHPSWYVGDGLLLPPTESMSRCVKFCKDVMNALTVFSRRFVPLASGGISAMTNFLFQRGAVSVALRLLSCSSVLLLCSGVPNVAYGSLATLIQEVFTASVERSLGGTGNGIISQIVDSQNAVSFLLSLPAKLAFKVYKSALPTAISTRDYPRVIALANIGIVAGGSGATDYLKSRWKNQERLISQCKRISNQSLWWSFLRQHRISFDQKLLDEDSGADQLSTSYSQKLLIPIIIRFLVMTDKRCGNPVQHVLKVLNRYAETFGLQQERIVEVLMEFLLSSPPADESFPLDPRLHLPKVELWVRSLFPLLQPKTKQAFALRRCVFALEQNKQSAKDYDRHILVLQLYRDTLQSFLGSHKGEKLDKQLLEAEHESILRRIDTLAILSSVFEGERKKQKPSFPPFFRPLPTDFSRYSDASSSQCCGILGKEEDCKEDLFDPLEPLHGLLLCDKNAATSLAPLGIPLGLPSGFLHARCLMEHFRLSSREASTLPSFEQDLLPVFARIQTSGDKAALAEWCAKMFIGCDEDRLKCLELALTWAIKFSSEAEQRKRISRDGKEPAALNVLVKEEMKALETVQRLSKIKSSLSDKVKVVIALQKDPALDAITKDLLLKLNETVWKTPHELPQPEAVVEVLLREASLLAAVHCLDSEPLSMQLFRQLSRVVNSACQALAEEHSHIEVGRIGWEMVERWLFQGDQAVNADRQFSNKRKADPVSPFVVKKASKMLQIEENCKEEDTINFVMDLSAIQDFSEETRANSSKEECRITNNEERSALRECEHEEAEQMTKRTALRVAFVLACHNYQEGAGMESTPRVGNDSLSRPSLRSGGKGKAVHGGLLARIEMLGSKQNTYVMACARDLLKVVFAKPELHSKSGYFGDVGRRVSTTITFAMRHRALRSASVLVPQEALEKVIAEEEYLVHDGSPCCSLKQCCFGAYVANECELLGMPLAHNSLAHISSMAFSTYARTLWRHHRDGDQNVCKGRLLLLLLQMSLKDEANIDATFVELTLKEMTRLHLPRSLLLACEEIAGLRRQIGLEKYDLLLAACGSTVNQAVATSAKAILAEVRERFHATMSVQEDEVVCGVKTVHRLGQLVQHFSGSSEGQGQLLQFIEVLSGITKLVSGNEALVTGFTQALLKSARHVLDQQHRWKLQQKLQKLI